MKGKGRKHDQKWLCSLFVHLFKIFLCNTSSNTAMYEAVVNMVVLLINMLVFMPSRQIVMGEHSHVMSHVTTHVLPKQHGSLHGRVVNLIFF